ncbi:MAG: yafV [Firmicutes bacterium]|nr:yafV [Bacillota bacterium]
MKIALVQLAAPAGDVASTVDYALSLMTKAVQQGAELCVLPELWTTGYRLKTVSRLAEPQDGPTLTKLRQFATAHQVEIIAGSIAELAGSTVYNTTYAIRRDGSLGGKYRKIHLFSLTSEQNYFSPGNSKGLAEMSFGKAGLIICYDLRFPELTRSLALSGCPALFVPAAWPETRGQHWLTLNIARAIENQCFVIAVNTVGKYGNINFFGNSLVVTPWGEILVQGSSTQEEIVFTELDFSLIADVRQKISMYADRRPEYYI